MWVVYLLIPTSNHNMVHRIGEDLIVVYLLIPTSNHNNNIYILWWPMVVYLLIPTSNHNFASEECYTLYVVYLLIPTSNHNLQTSVEHTRLLYIFWFLHQTTTQILLDKVMVRCISFDSYIKPQLYYVVSSHVNVVYLLIPTSNHNSCTSSNDLVRVVYLLIPTSNHNRIAKKKTVDKLYIFWFLHQTTTHQQL